VVTGSRHGSAAFARFRGQAVSASIFKEPMALTHQGHGTAPSAFEFCSG